jgi:hypothetical protein
MYPLTALNNLESLQLQCIHKSISNSHITKEVAQFACLVKLEIVGDGGALSRLIGLSTNPRHFNLQENYAADENLINIFSCKSLIHLNISPNIYLTDKCIEYVAHGYHKLGFLDVSHCEKMTDNILNILHTSTNLQSLRMKGFNFKDRNLNNIPILFPTP